MYAIALSGFCFFFTKICIEFNQHYATTNMITWINRILATTLILMIAGTVC